MESTEFPPLPKEHLEILEPLIPQQLLFCFRQANRDLREHFRNEHPDEAVAPSVVHMIENIFQ
jgi:hypothetical protein